MRFGLRASSFETPAAPAPQDEGTGRRLGGLLLGGGNVGARPFAEQHAVTDLEVDRDQLACFVTAARADRRDFALRGLFLGSVRNDDAACAFVFGIDAFDHDAVVERTEFHATLLGFCDYFWIGSRNGRVLAALHISL